ncbi:MAG: hypothetical protein BWX69_03061 [Planctomycetes bacterium ADurb.Bin069]|nr:MAG: hypothetical protein BWX69_03061 [Planctomycetes bacterium ADurb.Bin069]
MTVQRMPPPVGRFQQPVNCGADVEAEMQTLVALLAGARRVLDASIAIRWEEDAERVREQADLLWHHCGLIVKEATILVDRLDLGLPGMWVTPRPRR